jgi:diaminopimelate decarboxylase
MAKNIPLHLIPQDLSFTDEIILDAADQFGTPLFIYDRQKLELNWQDLVNHLPREFKVYYSVKANPSLAIIQVFEKLGANFEVASIGELMSVLQVGVSPSRIIFIGPGKTSAELKYAIEQQIYAIVSESPREVYDIQTYSHSLGKNTRIALRINPGQGKGMLAMGGETQFGMDPDTVLSILLDVNHLSNIKIIGIHGYLGTQVLDWEIIIRHSRQLLDIADQLQKDTGEFFSFIDLGGGFGIPYHESDLPLSLKELNVGLFDLANRYVEKYPSIQNIAVESGRFLVGSAGVFVTRVVDIKKSNDHYFVILDGGINAYGGFDKYAGSRPTPIRLLEKENSGETPLTLCGPLCTPLDRLAANILSPLPKINSLIVFYLAGAYGFSASPGLFLSHGFPSEILISQGEKLLIRQRTSPDQLIAHQKLF